MSVPFRVSDGMSSKGNGTVTKWGRLDPPRV